MTPDGVVGIGREAIETILLVAGPMLILGLVVGLMVSAFQAMTQINEATLTFLPKIVTMFLVLLLAFPWMLQIIVGFMTDIWGDFHNHIR
ncbi:MAG: flagellar biosynthesis protein FliQ [Nitrospira sp.]|nr:flagellar biosynthesis protein FliQ [Nitrospira sp.]MCA9469342.1 flagellar biosynthesis protein FliQ [Nitrospira sp.]MCB9711419.1 flagellar biosynthesis protein FliQ [Nitrospiraceae bacterium]MDR4486266.1 flagellar biosynthesis protein FliQ [Nitrospirales bacterium]MDR4489244.1 flagellar biosynthesis protein FliQ [Nitrospirales bacterium]